MFENEWFPYANAIGVTWESFWGMNPHIIRLLAKGYEEKIKQQDYLAWMFNQYTLSAVFVAIEHNFAGKKATSEYVRKPFLSDIQTEESKKMTEEERIQAERNRQYMILKVMQTNFELNKETRASKDGTGS